MPSQPIDYATYTKILDLALLRKSLRPGLTDEAALAGLAKEYAHQPQYAQAYQRYTGRQPTRVAVTKVAPVRPVRKADVATPVYEEIRLQGDALFRTGQAGSVWEGMGQYASQHPDVFQAYVEECRRVNGPPDPRLAKAMAALTPARSATDTLMQAITTRQAEAPGLSFVDAWSAVCKQAPELHDAYILEHRYHHDARTRPVEKAAPPSVEQILTQAQAQATAEGLTTEAVLEKMATAHPSEPMYYEAYRVNHLTAGLQEHHAAQVAKRQARP